MYDRLMHPALRRWLVVAGVGVVLVGALVLEGPLERVVLGCGILLIGSGLHLYAVQRGLHRTPVSDHEKEMMDSLTRMHTLFHAATDLSLAQPFKGIFATIDSIGSRVLKSSACAIYDTSAEFKVLYSRGVSTELSAAMMDSYSKRSGLFESDHLDVVPVSECLHDSRLKSMSSRLETERHRSLLLVPLVSEGRVIGYLLLCYNRPHSFSAEDNVVATAFGSLVAMTLRNGTLRHEIERTSSQFRALAEGSSEAVWIVDPSLQCRLTNRRAEELIGKSRAEWSGRPFVEFVADPDRALFREKVAATFSGRPQQLDLELAGRDQPVRLSVRTSAVHGESEVVAVLVLGRERATHRDEKTRPADPDRTLFGPLASGVAHLFGNSLSSILVRASLLRPTLQEGSPHGRHLDAIEKSGRSIARIVGSLLGFLHRYHQTRETFDLNLLTRETLSLIEHGLDPKIEIRADLHSEELMMTGDPVEVQRAIVLLIQNALEVVGEEGTIWIRTLRGALDDQLARRVGMNPGRCIILGVRDTGQWPDLQMVESTLESPDDGRVKDDELCRRLWVARESVKRLGGAIRLGSVQGQGATFSVYFPPATGGIPLVRPAVSHRGSRGETILVVSEDAELLDIASDALKGAGYATISVPNASDTRGPLDSALRDIDLVVLDICGPRSGGADAAQRLISRPDHPPVIILREYGLDIGALVKSVAAVKAFLNKPFCVEDLLLEVDEVLHGLAMNGRAPSR